MNPAQPEVVVLDGPPGLRFVQIDYTSELQMPPHAHEDAATLSFCLAGRVHEIRDRRTMVHQPLSLSLMPVGVSHANLFPSGASLFLVVLETAWVQRLRQVSGVGDKPLCCHGGRPAWIFSRMHREFRRRDDLTPLALEGMLLELVAELARGTTQQGPGYAPRWIRAVTEFLHAHFTEKLTSDAIAMAGGIHPAHLMRAFRQHHGCTVGEYVRSLRLEYALRLLEGSDAPLGEVALEAGFCDQGHFSRAFKLYTGLSPGQFRRNSGRASYG